MNLKEAAWQKKPYVEDPDLTKVKQWQEYKAEHRQYSHHRAVTVIGWIIILLVMFGAWRFGHGQELPNAPQPYFHSKVNRTLAAGETTARLLDFVSTDQFEHDPCNCIVEKGRFFGTFSLAPISRSTPASFAYQMGSAAGAVMISRRLWSESQKHHSRVLRMASRGVLLYDLRYEVEAPINNWRLIATNGKRGF